MVAGKDAELALVLVVVAALLTTLLIVPTCDILFPHFYGAPFVKKII